MDDLCPICKKNRESPFHCFFECQHARMVWFTSFLQMDSLSVNFTNPLDIWDWINQKFQEEAEKDFFLSFIAFTLWEIWIARNKFVFEGHAVVPEKIISNATKNTREYQKIWDTNIPIDPRPIAWAPPEEQLLKLNSDASWDPETNISHFGWIIRNDQGSMVKGGSSGRVWCSSPLAAEAEAMLYALRKAHENDIHNFIAESDSKILIDYLCKGCPPSAHISNIIDDIVSVVASLGLVVFSHAPRACNTIAHCLACKGKVINADWEWVEAPPWLDSLLRKDLRFTPNSTIA